MNYTVASYNYFAMPSTTSTPAPVARRQPITVVAGGQTFTFTTAAISGFPEAAAFLAHLLTTGKLQPHVAANYVKLAARLKRQGRLADLNLITHNVERTAANAYVRWRAESYDVRIAPVTRVLARHLKSKAALRHVRVHSLVPPLAGKTIPRVMPAPPIDFEALRDTIGQHVPTSAPQLHRERVPSSAWTLHVPPQPTAPHADPCDGCLAIELNDEELTAIAEAFEKAWRHRDVYNMPQDAYLFGEPPPEGVTNGASKSPEQVRLAKAEELLGWFWDAVSPDDRIFKNWSDEKWTELCTFLGRPGFVLSRPDST